MSRVLAATCSAGVVKYGQTVVPDAEILSDGTGASEGILILDGPDAYYFATNSSDLKTAIGKTVSILSNLHDALSKIASTLTEIGAGMTGATTAPPGDLAADVTAINASVTALDSLKTDLTTLEGQLK